MNSNWFCECGIKTNLERTKYIRYTNNACGRKCRPYWIDVDGYNNVNIAAILCRRSWVFCRSTEQVYRAVINNNQLVDWAEFGTMFKTHNERNMLAGSLVIGEAKRNAIPLNFKNRCRLSACHWWWSWLKLWPLLDPKPAGSELALHTVFACS